MGTVEVEKVQLPPKRAVFKQQRYSKDNQEEEVEHKILKERKYSKKDQGEDGKEDIIEVRQCSEDDLEGVGEGE